MKKYSITLDGHRTSISIESEFWSALKHIASRKECSIASIIKLVDEQRSTGLSTALRVYILKYFTSNSLNS
jgi:predicted DNA-binding ribbon-helix-helix protein